MKISTTQSSADQAAHTETSELVIGISGANRNASVAACLDGSVVAVCEQERLTRVRRSAITPGSVPLEALETVLQLAGYRSTSDVKRFATAEDSVRLPAHVPALRFEHHFAHAATAFHLSPFAASTVIVCDSNSAGSTSVWSTEDGEVTAVDWPRGPTSLASVYSECSRLLGFGNGQEHRLEALARLDNGPEEPWFADVIRYEDGAFWACTKWRTVVSELLAESPDDGRRIRVAGQFQRHLGELLMNLARDVRDASISRTLCLGGGLFFNTYFTTLLQQSGLFEDVFVAPNPGNAGIALGVAIAASGRTHTPDAVSPFLGPEYQLEEIKAALDNCKLSYEFLRDDEVLDETVDALQKGRLVGWFQGRMEWGHRALGNRSILASPLSPYVLDNLNTFLKHRERHRAYGFSVPEQLAPTYFRGPRASRFMEFEYELQCNGRLRHAIPDNATTVRVQTVPDQNSWFRRFLRLHELFGEATGIPILINTSFNGFSEPIVCSPRDAIRVFFSTGLDLLVLDRFVIRK